MDKKFAELAKLKENSWVRSEDTPEVNKKPDRKAGNKKKAPVVQRPVKSNMRALIAAARKKQLAEKGSGLVRMLDERFFQFVFLTVFGLGLLQSKEVH